tara:strand:+ start:5659 stop:6996 length:1338 start_codon:yes stop_codon:yes gene_type:complete
MFRFLYLLFQFIILLIIASWAIRNSKLISFEFGDVIISTSSSVLIIGLLIIIIAALSFQRFIFFLKQSQQKFKFYQNKKVFQRGHESFVKGMTALVNKDFKKAIVEANNTKKFLKDESLALLLQSETLKIEKKFDQLNDVYEKMLKNQNMNTLGLRGLMEQNLRNQDYHHAFVYGEKLFNLNPRIDKLYNTLINIIGKTNNWQKLIYLNEESLKNRIINKNTYAENKSIAFYEIAKIKHKSLESESIELMEKAIRLKENFAPYINFYIELLLDSNKLEKAKKTLRKVWSVSPHPELKNQIKKLSIAMNISYAELIKYITNKNTNSYESIILLTESFIEDENWDKARSQITSLLEHKPSREVCLIMAKIEENDGGDPQKINAWVSRSNFGKLGKIWICQITGSQQKNWSSVSKEGYFNTLYWKYPKNISEIGSTGFEINPINYIQE